MRLDSFLLHQKGNPKTAVIDGKSYCERFGFHSFPQFMYENAYTPEEKIIYFNHYVLDLVKRERADVIVIGIPGAYNKLNLKFPMRFGILPYLVSQAVTPDFAIMCTFYAEVEDEKLFEQLSVNCKYRLGFEVDCFHMSGTYIDVNALADLGELKYIHLPDELPEKVVKTKLNRLGCTVFNVYHPDGEKILSDKLFETLSPAYEEVKLEW